jgi:hypothetical protein
MASDCSYELLSNLNPAQCGVGNVTNRQIATSLWQILGIKVSLNRHTLIPPGAPGHCPGSISASRNAPSFLRRRKLFYEVPMGTEALGELADSSHPAQAPPPRAAQSSEHTVRFYEADDALTQELSRFIGSALGAGHLAIVIATNSIKRNKLKNQKPNPEWITHCSAFWGGQNWNIPGFIVNPMADLALGQIQNFDPSEFSNYPVFKDPTSSFPHGRSLCRLGFPFHRIEASFDETTKQFRLPNNTFPVPMFPNDGIYTRQVNAVNGAQTASFIETSTPGLRGQSGGPIFDVDGHVWAIQSRTLSLPLGFAPKVTQGNKETIEHQFMHVGHGAHSREIKTLLDAHDVTSQWAT